MFSYPSCEFVYGGIILFNRIPLVDNDDGCLTRIVRDSRDLLILLGNSYGCIDHNKAYVSALYRHMRAENAVFFDIVIDLGLAADARGVNEGKLAVIVFKTGVYRVSRGSRDIRNNKPLLTEHAVYYRGFSRVRLTDNSNLYGIVILFLIVPFSDSLNARVKKFSRARAVNGGYRNRLTLESKLVELVKLVGKLAYAVALVDAGYYRLSALFQHYRNVLVRCGKACSYVTHKHDNVCVLDSHLRLKLHLREDDIIALGLYSSRVNNNKLLSAPLGLAVDTVACHSGYVLNYRAALADKLIEKRALAHVRASYYCYNWFCHFITPLFMRGFSILAFMRGSAPASCIDAGLCPCTPPKPFLRKKVLYSKNL